MDNLKTWMRQSVTTVSDEVAQAATREVAGTVAGKVAKDSIMVSDAARKLIDEGKSFKLLKSEFRPVSATRIELHPEVAAAWKQSKINAARYKEETLGILTEKFGSRAKAEVKYDALISHFKKNQVIAANYTNVSFSNALKEGKIRSLYDLPLKTQIEAKGVPYVAARNLADLRLGLRDHNPLYVTVGGNKKFAKDIAKYGNLTVQYKEAELAGRVLFSDGNHNFFAKRLDARSAFKESRVTYFDLPHLTVNRIVKENIGPKEASNLIEGIVYGGIDPRKAAESIAILRPAQGRDLLEIAAKAAGIPIK
jgi:hypothetical protein